MLIITNIIYKRLIIIILPFQLMMRKQSEQPTQQKQYNVSVLGGNNYFNNQDLYNSIHGAMGSLNAVCQKSVRVMSSLATNVAYKARHSNLPLIQRKPIILKEEGEPATLFGEKYSYEKQEEFLCRFQQIIWLSYRSQEDGKISDAGWGCMIRVCQMLLAEALKQCLPKLHVSEIVKQFAENSTSIFSFDKICQIGNINQRWTSSTQILSLLKSILESQSKYKLNTEIYSSMISMEDSEEKGIKYPLLLNVNNRLGQASIPKPYHDHIFALLDHPRSIGIIGGTGGEAVFIVGYHQKNLIVMDPHYIQSHTEGSNIHFKQTPRGLPIDKVVPSLTFCFLVKNKKQHIEWLKDMAESNYFHHPYVGIQFNEEVAKKIYQERHPHQNSSDEDQFQILQ